MTNPEEPQISAAIAALTREAEDLERRAAGVRASIQVLRDVLALQAHQTPAPNGLIDLMARLQASLTSSTTRSSTTASASTSGPLNNSQLSAAWMERLAARRRIPTSHVVLTALREKPGIQFDELYERVTPLIRSTAEDKRKLLHSTLSYLKGLGRVREDEDGGLSTVVPVTGAKREAAK